MQESPIIQYTMDGALVTFLVLQWDTLSDLRKERFALAHILRVEPVTAREAWGRSVRHLVPLHLQSGSRQRWALCWDYFLSLQARTPACGVVQPTTEVGLSSQLAQSRNSLTDKPKGVLSWWFWVLCSWRSISTHTDSNLVGFPRKTSILYNSQLLIVVISR